MCFSSSLESPAGSDVIEYSVFRTAAAMTSEEKKERPLNMVSEAAHYNLTSDYAAHPMSPLGRVSYCIRYTLFISTKLLS